jgi:hypothetical protein
MAETSSSGIVCSLLLYYTSCESVRCMADELSRLQQCSCRVNIMYDDACQQHVRVGLHMLQLVVGRVCLRMTLINLGLPMGMVCTLPKTSMPLQRLSSEQCQTGHGVLSVGASSIVAELSTCMILVSYSHHASQQCALPGRVARVHVALGVCGVYIPDVRCRA